MTRTMPLRHVLRDKAGAALIEFTAVAVLFLGITFALVDFGRAFFQWVMAEKATQMAARIAAVRPPACPGVPTLNVKRDASDSTVRFGTLCADDSEPCADPGTVTCTGSADSPVVAAILERTAALLPPDVTPANFRFRYTYAELGFLGGPYVPLVTVELENVDFRFLALAPFVRLLGAVGFSESIAMPRMRATLPAEDLSEG